MIEGDPEVLECWSAGVLECWSAGVLECYTMSGIWDYVLKIITRDIRHYEDFVRNTLSANDLIRELHSHVAMTEIMDTSALSLAAQVD